MKVKHNRQEPPEEAEKSTPPKGEGKKVRKAANPKIPTGEVEGKRNIKRIAKESRVAQMQGRSTQGNGEGIDSEKGKKYTENGMEKVYARKPVCKVRVFRICREQIPIVTKCLSTRHKPHNHRLANRKKNSSQARMLTPSPTVTMSHHMPGIKNNKRSKN